MNTEAIWAALPLLLLLLVCPLAMWWMMRGMHGQGTSAIHNDKTPAGDDGEIERLRARIARLEAEREERS